MLAWRRMHLPTALALTLAVPALLAGAWAWLRFDGSLARLRAAERQEAEAALAQVQERFAAALARLVAAPPAAALALVLDGRGQPQAPFQAGAPVPDEVPADPPAWLEAALQHEAADQPGPALQFLAAGGPEQPLAAWLLRARCLARTGQTAAARAALAAAPVPAEDAFAALRVALLDARLAAAAGDRAPAQALRAAVFGGQRTVPLAAAPTVAAWLVEWSGAPADAAATRWRDAAEFAGQLLRGERPVPGAPQAVLPGPLTVVPATDRLWLLDGDTVRSLATAAAAATTGSWQVAVTAADGDTATPTRLLRGTTLWCRAEPASVLPSQRQERIAEVLLLAAAVSFVAGNLMVLAVSRRELQVSRLRRSFVDLVSHELRTPLTAVSLRAEMLARAAVPVARVDEYHRALYRDVQELGDLVGRILDFARLEQGRMPCEPRPLCARTLLARTVRAERGRLRAARQRVRCTVPRTLPVLHADPDVLGRALRNLLENAAKYAPQGSQVTVAAVADAGIFRLTVADQGPGIPAAERGRVFEPFARGPSAQGKPGSGLGLAIVAAAARVHGGVARVEDRAGGGAVFVLELPLTRGSAA